MIRKITESDYPRLIDIWESAVSATHDFLDRKDYILFVHDDFRGKGIWKYLLQYAVYNPAPGPEVKLFSSK